MTSRLLIISLALLLAACDIPGLSPDPRAAQRLADGKAIGGACRHALRGIEDCYQLNPKASKTAVFDGWKEMDQYMRENNIQGQVPTLEKEEEAVAEVKKPAAPGAKEKATEAKPKTADKSPEKAPTKTSEKATEKTGEKGKPGDKAPASAEAEKH
jgi:hypothetical protein